MPVMLTGMDGTPATDGPPATNLPPARNESPATRELPATSESSAPSEPPRWRRWLPRIIAVAVLGAVAALLLVRLDVIGGGGSSAARQSSAVDAELARRMTTTLEQMPFTQHQNHGGHLVGGDQQVKLVCAARVYGYEPATAATADEVVTVYGFHMCGVAEAGRPWEWAMKLVAPLVMRFDTRPPTVQMAEATAEVTYQDRVRQLIPEQYQQLAFEGALSARAMADLRRRYAAAAGA